MSKKNKNIEYIELPDRNGWMTTFSDMVTLLITFFVLLISMSSMDEKSMKELFGFFNDVVGPLEYADLQAVQTLPSPVDTVRPKVFFDSMSLSKSLLDSLSNKGIGGMTGRGTSLFEIREINRGLAIMLRNDILFDKGSAGLKKDALPILHGVADVLRNADSIISIEGHTDNQGDQEDLYRLSLMRSIHVLDYLVYTTGLSPTRFGVAGYGCVRPVATNTTELGRSQNRRVEIIVLKDKL